MLSTDETIAAVSTAAGSAARAIVRLSGPQALALAGRVFAPTRGRLDDLRGFRAADGLVRLVSPFLELPARAYVFRAPRSYTRQDVVELHIPGSPAAAGALASALVEAGAREAQPGEFTARAFLLGRLDLSAAEAVADVIDAADDSQLRAALAALDGQIHRLCESFSSRLAEALATVEASIDLADEGIEMEPAAALAEGLRGLARQLRESALGAAEMPETAQVPRAVLAGRPNVGKSSLLNALTGTDRAIISALAGTTRDVLSAAMRLEGLQTLLLQDAAGFAPSSDPLEALAHEAARRAMRSADAVLLVLDASAADLAEDVELLKEVRQVNRLAPLVILANKSDLLPAERRGVRIAELSRRLGGPVLACSALTGEGLEEVRRRAAEMLHLHACRSGQAMGLHERQKRLMLSAGEAARQAAELLGKAPEIADAAELVAVELRVALAEVGQISGPVLADDVLGRIFARFCVGK